MRGWRIARAFAIGIGGALAMDAATPLYAKAMEHVTSNHLTPAGTFLGLDGFLTAARQSASHSHTMLGPDNVARNNNKGPDDYFAPRYRNGKCVEDEGNTLVAEPTLGGGSRRLEGKSLQRALSLLCRKAQASTGREPRSMTP